ncbi:MAG: hypothetical protein WDN06_05305 [Asticcacaulis sp.]
MITPCPVFPVLPPLYYRDHFLEMMAFVSHVYGAVLGEGERRFMADFNALGETAQCLYIRMNNRKKAVFRASGPCAYGELGRIDDGLDELRAQGLCPPDRTHRPPGPARRHEETRPAGSGPRARHRRQGQPRQKRPGDAAL